MTDQKRARGHSELYLGPMFSGKTSNVWHKINRALATGLSCVFIKYVDDDRFGDDLAIRTHDGLTIVPSARLRIFKTRHLLNIEFSAQELDIGVDEGQFFFDLPEAVDLWTREGRRIYVAALNGDFRRKPFEQVSNTIPLACKIIKLFTTAFLHVLQHELRLARQGGVHRPNRRGRCPGDDRSARQVQGRLSQLLHQQNAKRGDPPGH